MTEQLNLLMRRYLTSQQFVDNLKQLKAFRGTYYSTSTLESLEASRLIRPRVRLRFPDEVARRMWFEMNEYVQHMRGPLEPDGTRWNAAQGLRTAITRFNNRHVYTDASHPFDDEHPEFSQFIERPDAQSFQPHEDRRVDVGNDVHPVLFDSNNVEDYYSAWQVLVAAEVADIGIHIRINMADAEIAASARNRIHDGRFPDGPAYELVAPARALSSFAQHEASLDAVVRAVEEETSALNRILRESPGGRVFLTEAQANEYLAARRACALEAATRHGVDADRLVALCRFLAERWAEWNDEGRPLIAEAYKVHLAAAIRMTQFISEITLDQIKNAVGRQGISFKRTLDLVWPDWVADQKERLNRTIRLGTPADGPAGLSDVGIAAFCDFIADERQDAIFMRLSSFEQHAFRDMSSPLAGMSSDLQGMAVAIEQAVRAMGGTGDQLYDMFKRLWKGSDVATLLKTNDKLARQGRPPSDWPAIKAEVESLRAAGGAGLIAAELVMAQRLRGAVHHPLPEKSQLELEKLLVGLLRAAVYTFAHLKRIQATANEAT